MIIFFGLLLSPTTDGNRYEVIGYVDYQLEWLRDDRIYVEVIDDPKVQNVACYVSRARLGGTKGVLGFVTQPSRISVSCRQVGPIKFLEKIKLSVEGEDVFTQSESWLFKELRITRFVDRKRRVLIYLAWTTKLFQGSPYNSMSTVALDEPSE